MSAAALAIPANSSRPVFSLEDHSIRASAVEAVAYREQWLDKQIGECLPIDTMRRAADLARTAANAPPDRRIVVAAVGLLVGSRARQPDSPETFIRALEFDLVDLGFSPTVVVVALQRLRREAKFTPEICEIITACEVERVRLRGRLAHVERAIRWRAGLEADRAKVPALMAQAEAMPETRERKAPFRLGDGTGR